MHGYSIKKESVNNRCDADAPNYLRNSDATFNAFINNLFE